MSAADELTDALVWLETYNHGSEGATDRAVDLLCRYNAERTAAEGTPAMTRVAALAAAREHVDAMSTNARGYQDGVRLADKVQAIETFARFLMGESQ